MDAQKILEKIDSLFKENRSKDAENFMLQQMDQAAAEGNAAIVLLILNELLGHYRVTSEREKLQDTIDRVLLISRQTQLNHGVDYATTLLNVATAYRSMDECKLAEGYYEMVRRIYQQNLSPGDLRIAGFYNNYSLLKQEMGEWKEAELLQLTSLQISEKANAGYEIGTSYSNLAGTYIGLKEYAKAEEYAKKAIELFESRGELTSHYCAALFSLGICHYEKGQYEDAEQLLDKSMQLLEESAGQSDQYRRMVETKAFYSQRRQKEQQTVTQARAEAGFAKGETQQLKNALGGTERKAKEAGPLQPASGEKMAFGQSVGDSTSGMELCRRFYESYGAPMIAREFPDYKDRIAAGLFGEGSDCLGFDDAYSRDHDWGPGFCLFVTRKTYEEIGEKLQKCYENLPSEFMGYQRLVTPQGKHRLGVKVIEDYFTEFLGTAEPEKIDYSKVEDYALSAACSGELFEDPEGEFSRILSKLKSGYPERIQYLKLAEDAARFSQTGQYNYFRMKQRGDDLTADGMLQQCYRQAMQLLHHACNVYPPHDKWLKASALRLLDGPELMARIHEIYRSQKLGASMDIMQQMTEELGAFLARILYDKGYISDVAPYLGEHVDELLKKADYSSHSNEELVNLIARLEFEAFDKVKNEGGRANCQNNWPTFSVMRKSQYLTWNRNMLLQYYYDFNREYERGHNLITEKYGRMMESTARERYEEIKENFPELSTQKKAVIEQIVAMQVQMMEVFAAEHPSLADNARNVHTYEDDRINTSYETYLRGEISTYSDKMLQLYGQYVVECVTENKNIAYMTIENTAKLYGFKSLEEFEQKAER